MQSFWVENLIGLERSAPKTDPSVSSITRRAGARSLWIEYKEVKELTSLWRCDLGREFCTKNLELSIETAQRETMVRSAEDRSPACPDQPEEIVSITFCLHPILSYIFCDSNRIKRHLGGSLSPSIWMSSSLVGCQIITRMSTNDNCRNPMLSGLNW